MVTKSQTESLTLEQLRLREEAGAVYFMLRPCQQQQAGDQDGCHTFPLGNTAHAYLKSQFRGVAA